VVFSENKEETEKRGSRHQAGCVRWGEAERITAVTANKGARAQRKIASLMEACESLGFQRHKKPAR
jgi:hypothetical protein